MTSLDFSEGFVDDLLKVERESKREEILAAIELLEHTPEIGSKLLPESITVRFGADVRKLIVSPFDVIYQYFPNDDTVFVHGLLHQREIW